MKRTAHESAMTMAVAMAVAMTARRGVPGMRSWFCWAVLGSARSSPGDLLPNDAQVVEA